MRVTYYHPFGLFHPARTGSHRVAEAHFRYFKERGIRPSILVREIDPDAAGRRIFEEFYSWCEEILIFSPHRHRRILRLLSDWRFPSYLEAHIAMAQVPRIRSLLVRTSEVFFANYVFSAPLLDALPRSARKILEATDVMTYQFLGDEVRSIAGRRHLEIEHAMYGFFDAVSFLNSAEARSVPVTPGTRVLHNPIPFDVPEFPERENRFDLLFVGSDHAPNREGVNWFLETVFRPALAPRGLRWAIAGSVGRGLSIREPGVEILGVVDDLDLLYACSNVVVVPLLRGAGVSVKTLEALSRGKAVVTTPVGTRGLPDPDDALLVADTDGGFAVRVLELAGDAGARAALKTRAQSYVRQHFGWAAYASRMDELMRR